jgi:hypothetical protein
MRYKWLWLCLLVALPGAGALTGCASSTMLTDSVFLSKYILSSTACRGSTVVSYSFADIITALSSDLPTGYTSGTLAGQTFYLRTILSTTDGYIGKNAIFSSIDYTVPKMTDGTLVDISNHDFNHFAKITCSPNCICSIVSGSNSRMSTAAAGFSQTITGAAANCAGSFQVTNGWATSGSYIQYLTFAAGTPTSCGPCRPGQYLANYVCNSCASNNCGLQFSQFTFDTRSGDVSRGPDGSVPYPTPMDSRMGTVKISDGTATVGGQTIPRGYQIWTVGTTGTYHILAAGSAGGNSFGNQTMGSYGNGAVVKTTRNFTAGDTVLIVVGQRSFIADTKCGGGGGGASWVSSYSPTAGAVSVAAAHTLVLVAGGGGGDNGNYGANDYGMDASFTTSGTLFRNSAVGSVATNGGGGGSSGGNGGNGADGTVGQNAWGGSAGGGGFKGNALDVAKDSGSLSGGRSFLNGAYASVVGCNLGGWGGFGGGGANWNGGGGGGGYSGGQGASQSNRYGGGGGGSYDWAGASNAATPYTSWNTMMFGEVRNTYLSTGYNSESGFVKISMCAAGTYQDSSGNCVSCPAGTVGTAAAQTSQASACTGACAAGLSSAPGSSSSAACMGCAPTGSAGPMSNGSYMHWYTNWTNNLAKSCGAESNSPCAVTASSEHGGDWLNVKANDDGWTAGWHNGVQETRSWLRIDLGTTRSISAIKHWARQDCCRDQSDGFEIWIGNSATFDGLNNIMCYKSDNAQKYATSDFSETGSCIGVGRYVFWSRLISTAGWHSFAELQVFPTESVSRPLAGTVFNDVPGYMVHRYTAVGGLTTTVPGVVFSQDTVADVLMIGGGGGGGSDQGAGGGAGALLYYSGFKFVAGQSYNFTVGAGGSSKTTAGNPGNDGSDSSINNIFVARGGAGGNGHSICSGRTGGSGGGGGTGNAGSGTCSGGTAVSTNAMAFIGGFTLGFSGGTGNQASNGEASGCGGGGGAGGAGQNANTVANRPGIGGDGVYGIPWAGSLTEFSTLFGSAYTSVANLESDGKYYVAGGGGGGGVAGTAVDIAGGKGGGGTGKDGSGAGHNGADGKANTGSGGGGGAQVCNRNTGGGSGLILIRYSTCQPCSSGTSLQSGGRCSACAAGSFSGPGQTSCTVCPSNSGSLSGADKCVASPGYYQSHSLVGSLSAETMNLARSCGASNNSACTATSSSLEASLTKFAATFGNDGKISTVANTDFVHTSTEANPWWRVDMSTSKSVVGGKLVHRQDCCQSRMDGFKIWIGNSSTYNGAGNVNCYTHTGTSHTTSPYVTLFSCNGNGQYVFLHLSKTEAMNFDELEVYPLITTTVAPNQLLVLNNDFAGDAFWGLSSPIVSTFPQHMHPTALLAAPQIAPTIPDNDYPVVTDATGRVVRPYVWYKFDSANCTGDASGNGFNLGSSSFNSGTLATCNNFKAKRGSSSAAFVRSSKTHFSMPTTMTLPDLQRSGGITVSFWGLMSDTAPDWDRFLDFSVGNLDTVSTNYFIVCKKDLTSRKLYWYTGASGNVVYTTTNDYVDNNWHFIVWAIDNLGQWTIWIDNVKLVCPSGGSCVSVTANMPKPTGSEVYQYYIGRNGVASDVWLEGNIDDLRIYKTVLTDTQVTQLYQGRLGIYSTSFAACPDASACTTGSKHCDPTGAKVCCGAGTYFRDGIDYSCQSCPLNTVSTDGSGTSCTPCAEGTYAVNRTTCVACAAGTASAGATTPVLNGGNVFNDVNGYVVHQFLASNNATTTQTVYFAKDTVADVLVVGGGGGGGCDQGGGGGAGALLYYSGYKFAAGTSYTVTVGAGGARSTGCTDGLDGSDSSIGNIFLAKGGGGGQKWESTVIHNGGCGGGGSPHYSTTSRPGGAAVNTNVMSIMSGYTMGKSGGNGNTASGGDGSGGGGGGGAGTAGQNANTVANRGGTGGDGVASITWAGASLSLAALFGNAYTGIAALESDGAYYIAAGGAGGGSSGGLQTNGWVLGGKGGGGQSRDGDTPADDAINNAGKTHTGSGGGGMGQSGLRTSSAGGSGLILIRYALCQPCASGTFAASSSSSACAACASSSYAPQGSAACQSCPANSVAVGDRCVAAVGKYQNHALVGSLSAENTNLARSCGADGKTACATTSSSQTSASEAPSKGNDNDFSVYFQSLQATDSWWRVDFTSSKSVTGGVFYSIPNYGSRMDGFKVWIGNSATYNGAGNVNCYTHSGPALLSSPYMTNFACVGSGQYLFIHQPSNQYMHVLELIITPLITTTIGTGQLLALNNDFANDAYWSLPSPIQTIFPQYAHPTALWATPALGPTVPDNDYPVVTDGTTGRVLKPYVWYKFDGAGCTTDASGNGFTLTFSSLASGTLGVCGSTFVKRGNAAGSMTASSKQHFRIASTTADAMALPGIQTSTGITFAFWARTTSSSDVWARLVDLSVSDTVDSNTNMAYFLVFRYNNLRLVFQIASVLYTTAYDIIDSNWHYYVWSISTTGDWTIWIDNVKVVCPTGCGTSKTANMPATSGTRKYVYNLGRSDTNGGTDFLDGNIDDFRVYRTVLTDTQVSQLYQGRLGLYTASFSDCPDTSTCASGSKHCNSTGDAVCCAAGQYLRDGVDGSCQPCPRDTFSADGGSVTCAACPSGTLSGGGAASCATCAAGKVAVDTSTLPSGAESTYQTAEGAYAVYAFTSVGASSITFNSPVIADVLLVGGGGGGASGGGGGGQVLTLSGQALSGTYTITVGSGGNGVVVPNGAVNGNNGGNSIISDSASFTQIALGGGGGSKDGTNLDYTCPGSTACVANAGGGGSNSATYPFSASKYSGNKGGQSSISFFGSGGGGGGAGAVGANPSADGTRKADTGNSNQLYCGGAGGVGVSNLLRTNSVTFYGGGGGGGTNTDNQACSVAPAGGSGVGGNGSTTNNGNGLPGAANTGGGGGGADVQGTGAAGGSGIVVIRVHLCRCAPGTFLNATDRSCLSCPGTCATGVKRCTSTTASVCCGGSNGQQYMTEGYDSQCQSCAGGLYGDGSGTTCVAQCPAGQYMDGGGCKLCPAGTFRATPGALSLADCTACPQYSYTVGAGSSACNTCAANL